MRNSSGSNIIPVAVLAIAAAISPSSAQARFKTLYSFAGGNAGAVPGGLLRDASGNLYGTTSQGGGGNCHSGCGTIFKLAPDGTETVLHSFAGPYSDGADASSVLVKDRRGNLYGTTYEGGAGNEGTVYKLTATGKERLLHSFVFDGADGIGAFGLMRNGDGNLYGTTSDGGAYGGGTVFKLARDGTESVLHSFGAGTDGAGPYFGALIRDESGNLYGTTRYGGAHGQGTVYKLAPDGTETRLYSFAGGNDGSEPYAGVIMDTQGDLYGTTVAGGANAAGTVFRLAHDGTETVLHAFTGGADGAYPAGCCLILDDGGNLYGTTGSGGDAYNGVAFKLAPDGTETVLHAFTGGADGDSPGGLITDKRGNFYGTTAAGGAHGAGTVFELKN